MVVTNKTDLLAYTLSTSIATVITLDGSAALGAFFGAVLYVAIASDSTLKQRFVFMTVSIVAGYLGAPMWKEEMTGFVAFIISAGIIGVVIVFHKLLNKLDISNIIEILKVWRK